MLNRGRDWLRVDRICVRNNAAREKQREIMDKYKDQLYLPDTKKIYLPKKEYKELMDACKRELEGMAELHNDPHFLTHIGKHLTYQGPYNRIDIEEMIGGE